MNKTNVFLGIAITILFLFSSVSVLGSINSVNQTESKSIPAEIKLCGVFPISQRPDAGPDRRDGFLIAIDEINAQTGADRILPEGVKLVPLVKDDLNTADGGTAAAQSCISEGANLVIGSSGSTVSAAMATELTPEKIVQISYASTSPSLSDRTKYPYFMRNVGSDGDQGLAIADLVASFGLKKGATINTDDSYGTGLVSVFKTAFTAVAGNTLVSEQTFTPAVTDVTTQVQAIKDAQPDFVLLHAIDKDAKTVFKKASELGLTSGNILWFITDGSSSTATFAGDDTVKTAMNHVIGTTPASLQGGKYQTFNDTWFSVSTCAGQDPCAGARTNAGPNSYAPLAYDAVYIAAKGIASACDFSVDSLLSALYNVKNNGAGGFVQFNSKGEPNGKYDVVTLNGDSYSTVGGWNGTLAYYDNSVTLPNGTTWNTPSALHSASGSSANVDDSFTKAFTGTCTASTSGTPGFEYVAFFMAISIVAILKKKI
jgi:branched-chain amino acid transport system substrate-binding protein